MGLKLYEDAAKITTVTVPPLFSVTLEYINYCKKELRNYAISLSRKPIPGKVIIFDTKQLTDCKK